MKRTIPPATSVGVYPAGSLSTLVRVAEILDTSEVDTLWIGDSPILWHEVWTAISLCMAATETLRFGPAVTNPKTRHWSVTASALQSLDEYSPGRIRLGIGVGDSAIRRFTGKVATIAQLEEAVLAIRALLAHGQPPEPHGNLLWDKPVTRVEIVVSGSGVRTLEAAGRLGDAALIIPGVRRERLAEVDSCISRGALASGKDPAAVRRILWVAFSVGEEAKAWDHVRPWVASVLRHPLAFSLDPETELVRKEIAAGYDFSQHMSNQGRHGSRLPLSTLRDFAVAGPAPEVTERVTELLSLPVDEVVLVLMGDDLLEQARGAAKALQEALRAARTCQ